MKVRSLQPGATAGYASDGPFAEHNEIQNAFWA
jgi:hypothetical protein